MNMITSYYTKRQVLQDIPKHGLIAVWQGLHSGLCSIHSLQCHCCVSVSAVSHFSQDPLDVGEWGEVRL